MSITDEQVRRDWERAVGLDEITDDPEALTIRQLSELLGLKRDPTIKWAELGVEAGTVEKMKVYRSTGSGTRWQTAYKLIAKVTAP